MVSNFIAAILVGFITVLCIAITSKITKKYEENNACRQKRRLPPGGGGLIPFIGETWEFWQYSKQNNLRGFFQKKREKYGGAEVFWTSLLSHKMVFMGGADASRFLLANEDRLVKEWMFKSFVSLQGVNNLLVQSGERHRRLRRAVMPGLGPSMLQSLMTKIEGMTKQHIAEKWHVVAKRATPSNTLSAVELLKGHILDLATTLLLGVNDRHILDKVALYFEPFSKGLVSFPLYLPGTRYYSGVWARTKLLALFRHFLSQRRLDMETHLQDLDQPKDMLSVLISTRDDLGKPLSDEEILDLLISLLDASHDTLVSTMSLACKFLSEHPTSLQKVLEEQQEITNSKTNGEGLAWSDLIKMNYTWMVIQETLRLQPSCFMALKVALKDFEYKGFTIPQGWKIMHYLPENCMDEEYFKDAKKFNPSRFMDHMTPRFSFFPFGGGCHTCAGIEVARMFSLIFFYHLVPNLKWNLANPSEKVTMDPSPIPMDGLILNVVDRERTM